VERAQPHEVRAVPRQFDPLRLGQPLHRDFFL
jgi:hypothetical protein